MAVQWTPALAVGVPEVDAPNQELFRRADRLIQALRDGDRGRVLPLLQNLEDWAAKQFAAEEKLMREAGYPGLDRHAEAHRTFRTQYAGLAAAIERSGPTAAVALTAHNWLSDWLRQHVAEQDAVLARFLAARAS
jgi:hemerythrin